MSENPQHPQGAPPASSGRPRPPRARRDSGFTLALVLARRLRIRRVELGLTRDRLALRADVPSATIKAFERTGRISLEAFMRLASALRRLDDLSDVLLRRQRPDSPRVIGRRMKRRTRGRAATEESL